MKAKEKIMDFYIIWNASDYIFMLNEGENVKLVIESDSFMRLRYAECKNIGPQFIG